MVIGAGWVFDFAKAKNMTISARAFCFSFGSGTWEEGAEAKTLIDDATGSWLSFAVDVHTPVMFELDKATNVEDSVKEYAKKHKEDIMEMGNLLSDLEGIGEVPSCIILHNSHLEAWVSN